MYLLTKYFTYFHKPTVKKKKHDIRQYLNTRYESLK